MDTTIELIPAIPLGLRDAAQQGLLVPFIGAGVSRLAGSPGWADFADGVLRKLVDDNQLSYADIEVLRHLSPRVKLSLAQTITKQQIDYSKLLNTDDQKKKDLGNRLYRALSKLGKTFITTNYDDWLDNMNFPEPTAVDISSTTVKTPNEPTQMNVVWTKEAFVKSLFQQNTVIHLHGSVKDQKSMVLTVSDYVRHYANDRGADTENPVLTLLENLFQNRTVLFVGYGVEEYELLEPIIMKAQGSGGEQPVRHYLLQGFFSHEKSLMRSLHEYYLNQLGILLIPFQRDKKDRDQLVDVLEAFAEQIPASAPSMLQKLIDMEDLL